MEELTEVILTLLLDVATKLVVDAVVLLFADAI